MRKNVASFRRLIGIRTVAVAKSGAKVVAGFVETFCPYDRQLTVSDFELLLEPNGSVRSLLVGGKAVVGDERPRRARRQVSYR
ncbi:MAG: hypothetical protein JRN39_04575 [Nitrososphaerota archaeon]|nr:hypothetical protein [Nitrososphaerota archaeon]MDG6939660.1 hypothetical protein [Nitrososphaerota archaeon]